MYGTLYDLVMRLPDMGQVDVRWILSGLLIGTGSWGLARGMFR
jgi:hypothetical protein